MSRPAYGGQAVIEGVLMRGQRTVALACRRPDGGIYRYREIVSSPLQRSRLARLPLLRGVVVLGESLLYGTRMVWAISFLPDIRRVFAYHGAEHMTIHAFEHDVPLDPAHVELFPTAHPRCATAFLLLVVLVAAIVFAFMPRTDVVVDLVARLLLVLPVAAISYELLRLGAAHEGDPLVRVVVWPGLLLQAITTRRPDPSMIEVAIASLEEAVAGDREAAAA
ncbi:MAG: DUF1385 domain-containing protein [Chloroflexota bacterium]|nr:DUF1385 domain-containing protein [Chloroflexota bacterium]